MTLAHDRSGRIVYSPAAGSATLTVLATPGLLVALGSTVSAAVLEVLWLAVTADSMSLENVVQSIPLQGPDSVASFSVAAWENDGAGQPVLTLVARGQSVVDVHTFDGERRRFSSRGLIPWHLASFRDVAGLGFGVAETSGPPADTLAIDGSEHVLVKGTAPARRVAWLFDDRATVVTRTDTAEAANITPPHDAEITLERSPGRRRGRHSGAPEVARLPAPVRLGPRQTAPVEAPARRRPARVRIGAAAPFELHVPVYVGRRPRPPRQVHSDQVMLVEVPSPTKEVSASHLEILQRDFDVVATDLRSTNGTAVTLPGAPRIKLQQGESIVLPPYSRIDIGDGNVIEILPGAD